MNVHEPGSEHESREAPEPVGRAARFLQTRSVVEGDWFRVHPITPILTGWKVVAILIAVLTAQNLRWIVDGFTWMRALIALGGLVLIVLVAIGLGFLSWWFTRYRLTERSFERRSGWLFRAEKTAELDRIQTIEIQRPLIARLTGFASVTIEVAGGAGSNFSVQYLRVDEADFLRRVLLEATHHASGRGQAVGAGPAPDGPAPESAAPDSAAPETAAPETAAPESAGSERERSAPLPMLAGEELPWRRADLASDELEIAAVPVSRLLASSVLNLGALIAAAVVLLGGLALFVATVLFDVGGPGLPSAGALAGMIPVAFGFVAAAWQHINRGWNYRSVAADTGLRITGGLADTTARNIPPGRVQAVTISQPVLWRRFGWWRLNVTIAGTDGASEGASSRWTLPVGTQDEVLRFLDHLLPTLDVDDPAAVIRSGMSGKRTDGGFRMPARPARWLDPIAYPRAGYLTTPSVLLFRAGRLERSLTLIPHERPQSVRLTSGPLERRLGMATVWVDIAGAGMMASIHNVMQHLDRDEAEALFAGEAAIGATARRFSDRSSWSRPAAAVGAPASGTASAPGPGGAPAAAPGPGPASERPPGAATLDG